MVKLKERLVLLFLVVWSITTYLWLHRHVPDSRRQDEAAAIKSSGDDKMTACDFPRLDPWHPGSQIPELLPGRPPPPPLVCHRKEEDLVYELDFRSSEIVNISKGSASLAWRNCYYRTVHRGTNISDIHNDNVERLSEECFPIIGPRTWIPPEHEFLAVFCNNSQKTGEMIQILAQTPLKPEVEARCSSFDSANDGRVNMVILGWDSVSHLEFQRSLPRVRKVLTEDLAALWFEGYQKVGEMTFQNTLPFTTGLNEEEVLAGCAKNDSFDDCPFFWKKAAQAGYRTSFAEDAPGIGCFTWLRNGFIRQPVDHYLRPLARVGANNLAGPYGCWGPQPSLQFLLNYVKTLATSMGTDKRFVSMILSVALTHDSLSAGTRGEDLLLDFLAWMQAEGHFNSTVFIFMSDHGMRGGDIWGMPRGAIEDRMPFFYAVFPKWFRRKYPEAMTNFRTNRDRFVTHYDAHSTLLDLLSLGNIGNEALVKRSRDLENEAATLPRGISLFLPIPRRRTCAMAGIEAHYCVCGRRKPIPQNVTEVLVEGAKWTVSHLNTLVDHKLCAPLSLVSVTSASLLVKEEGGDKGKKYYDMTFVTVPGNARFEATLVKREPRPEKGLKWKWSLSGSVSRTNLYGNQSLCVQDRKAMKPYCYCRNFTA